MAKYITNERVINNVDPETGEVTGVTIEKNYKAKVNEEQFFMVFTKMVGVLIGIERIADIKILLVLCKIADYNTGIVKLPSKIKQEVCEEAGVSLSNFSKNIRRLIEAGALSGERDVYLINPAIFWKGDRKERAKLLESKGLNVSFNFTNNELDRGTI